MPDSVGAGGLASGEPPAQRAEKEPVAKGPGGSRPRCRLGRGTWPSPAEAWRSKDRLGSGVKQEAGLRAISVVLLSRGPTKPRRQGKLKREMMGPKPWPALLPRPAGPLLGHWALSQIIPSWSCLPTSHFCLGERATVPFVNPSDPGQRPRRTNAKTN